MTYTETNPCKTPEFREKMRAIALAGGYKPPSQKGKKRQSVWNKGKKMPEIQGSKNRYWKGDRVSYVTAHQWVRRHKGATTQCSHCGVKKTTPRSIQWANIDHKYRRELDDYIQLCVKCHRAHDKQL